jgi:DNA-binding transcriptional ArsR family regulator
VKPYEGMFEALGDPTRRAVFELLADGPHPVGELARRLPVSRPAVSQHLRVLRDAGLVADHPEGTRRVYSVNPDALEELRGYVEGFWQRALVSFKQHAEQETANRLND